MIPGGSRRSDRSGFGILLPWVRIVIMKKVVMFSSGSKLVILAVFLGFLGIGCGKERSLEAPDLLLLTIDTLRADHLGCYGHEGEISPQMDALAAEGVLFDVAYAPMGTTCPSHATLFTGRQPYAHGLVRNGFSLVDEERTLAESLRDAGYRTAAFVSSYPVKGRFGFDQGFDVYEDLFVAETQTFHTDNWSGEKLDGGFDRVARGTFQLFRDWLKREASSSQKAPLFVWLHFFDPHGPYVPRPELVKEVWPDLADPRKASRRLEREGSPERLLYEGEVRFVDDWIGRSVAAFEANRTEAGEPLVVLTSDHGEGLNDHGWLFHNRTTYEEEVRVPLIFRWRGRLPAAKRSAQPAHLVDLYPTLLGLLGLAADEAISGNESDGLDLSPWLIGDEPVRSERPLFLQRPYYSEGRPELTPPARGWGFGLREGRWKFFSAPEDGVIELYDLGEDPGEKRNLASERPDLVERFEDRLARWKRTLEPHRRDLDGEVPADARDALRALGYLEDGEPTSGGR